MAESEAALTAETVALGQNVLQDQAQEGRPAQRAHRILAGFTVAIAEATFRASPSPRRKPRL